MNGGPRRVWRHGGLTLHDAPPSLSCDSAPAARRPEGKLGFGGFGDRTGNCWAKGWGSWHRTRGEQHAPRNPGTLRGGSVLPPPAIAARTSQQSPAAEAQGPTPPRRAARTYSPYRPPLPGAREHNPLRTVRGSGLPHR